MLPTAGDLGEDRLRTRATRTLFSGVALGSTGIFVLFSSAALIAEDITGTGTWAGLPGTFAVLGVAAGSAFLSSVMARRGRKPGLILGYLLGVGGVTGAFIAVLISSFPLLLAGMFVLGAANSSNQLARYAAADLQPAHRRAWALGLVVWAGTVGAIAGPNLLGPSASVAATLGLPDLSGAVLLALVAFAAAAVLYLVRLRTDAAAELPEVDGPQPEIPRPSMWRTPTVQVALVALVASQVVMVFIMTMTPLHIRHGGHGLGLVGFVMSAHIVGMYVLAPVAGRLVDRFGSISVIFAGQAMLAAAAVGSAAAPLEAGLALAVPLALLGFGWSFSFVAGSALLAGGAGYAERARVQGMADTLVWLSAAGASFGSGMVLAAAGFQVLSLVGAALVAVPVTVILSKRRRLRPAT